MISMYCLTLDKWRPSWIFYPQCNVENILWQHHCVGHTLKPCNRHQKYESASIVLKMISFYCLSWDTGGHLRFFTHNAMYNVIADHTTRSGIPENPIVDTKIMKLLLFCRKLWQFKVWPSPNGGHFEFLEFSQIAQGYPLDIRQICVIDPMRVWNQSKKKL